MPLIFRKNIDTGGEIGVWESSESDKELIRLWGPSQEELDSLQAVRHTARKREIMTVRILLRQLSESETNTPAIAYDDFGKPFLLNRNVNITISHSRQMVGLMMHPDSQPGLDIEMIDDRIFRIASKFLSTSEKVHLQSGDSLSKLHLAWAAKEVVYKIHGKRGVDFKSQLHVNPFEITDDEKNRHLAVDFSFDGMIKQFNLTYILMPGMVTVYGTERESIVHHSA